MSLTNTVTPEEYFEDQPWHATKQGTLRRRKGAMHASTSFTLKASGEIWDATRQSVPTKMDSALALFAGTIVVGAVIGPIVPTAALPVGLIDYAATSSPTFTPSLPGVIRGKSVAPDTNDEVLQFLQRNPDLQQVLDNVKSNLTKHECVVDVSLEYYVDPEEGFEQIFIDVKTDLKSDQEINEFEDSVMEQIVDPVWEMLDNRVALSIR